MTSSQGIVIKVPEFKLNSPVGIDKDSFVTTVIILDIDR